ncbi:MurR/RpiR family transcriptional regulator [Paenibacillus sp. FSL W8-0426]|uniref:MurR/RpiR family transcriptional regulator n=1 Tax=Paenibacillus sp. FSL W8-0426 TaxID=2921714 RepID=UPI0030DBEA9A
MNLFAHKDQLSPGHQKIADFIERHPEDMLFMTEQEIADRLGTSIATVSRFWRAVGYDNAKAFKIRLRTSEDTTPALKLNKTISRMDTDSLPVQLLEASVAHLQETLSHMKSGDLEQAAVLFSEARRVYVYAPGPSAGLAELLSFRLSRFGMTVVRLAGGGHELLETLMHMQKEDVVLLLCFTRLLPEAEVILDYAINTGSQAVLVTDREDLLYGMGASISFYVSRGELGEFHSMVTPLLLMEQMVLAVGLKQKEQALAQLERLGELRSRYADRLPRG